MTACVLTTQVFQPCATNVGSMGFTTLVQADILLQPYLILRFTKCLQNYWHQLSSRSLCLLHTKP